MDVVYIFRKCNETQRWTQQVLDSKWLCTQEETAQQKIISCNKITELERLGKFLYKVNCKWENEVTKTVQGLDKMTEEEM